MKTEHPSVCPLDCPDTCSLTVTVEAERIVNIRGSRANPYTDGVLCAKVPRAYPEFVHGERRLLTPLRRLGARGEGKFARISWTEALDEIHHRVSAVIAEHGPQAVMPFNYAGPHGLLAGGSMDLRFFHRLGATLLDRKPLCGGIRTEAWVGTFGTIPGIRPEQVEQSKLIVAWGNNVTWSNLHLMPIINRARRAGAKLVVVDPRRVKIAEQADLHLALRPGTDVVLAWAIAAELERRGALRPAFIARWVEGFDDFMALARPWTLARAAETCGLPEADVARFAEWYATITPSSISVGNGLERNRNGGSGIRAVLALPALAGRFAVAGGGLVNGAGFAFPKTPQKLARPDLAPAGTRTLNIVDIGRHLTEGDAGAAAQGAVHLQPQSGRGAPRSEPHAPGARARGRLHRRDRGRDDRQHAVLRHRAAGLDQLRVPRPLRRLRPALAAARRAGHPAAGRVAAEHRDLPPAGPRASATRSPSSRPPTPS